MALAGRLRERYEAAALDRPHLLRLAAKDRSGMRFDGNDFGSQLFQPGLPGGGGMGA